MNMLKRCLDYLKKHEVRYVHSIHAPAYTAKGVAVAEMMPARDLAKTLLYFNGSAYGMLVLPGDRVVDFQELKRVMRWAEARLATEAELDSLFPDCDLGAMPPLGGMFGLPVLMDETVATQEVIAFNAGTHRDVVRMSFGDYCRLADPLVAAFTVREEAVTGN